MFVIYMQNINKQEVYFMKNKLIMFILENHGCKTILNNEYLTWLASITTNINRKIKVGKMRITHFIWKR